MSDRFRSVDWMTEGTRRLLDVAGTLSDADLTSPSVLPGWSRAHVLGHVARNADALGRLLEWARTGVETPMYTSPAARDAEIQASSAHPPQQIRRDLVESAETLRLTLATLPGPAWATPLRSAQGRGITAEDVPWMRVREVWLHAVDLDAGVGLADVPPDLVHALIDEVTRTLTSRDGCPSFHLVTTDSDRRWTLGSPDEDGAEVRAPAPDLLAWLTGRAGEHLGAPGGVATALPRWL